MLLQKVPGLLDLISQYLRQFITECKHSSEVCPHGEKIVFRELDEYIKGCPKGA